MCKRVGLLFVGCALYAAPLVAAPNDSRPADTEQPAVAVQQVQLPMTGIRDEVAMVLIGTVLIGLGAAVRRAA